VKQIIENIILLWGWKRYALAFLAGALTMLALPPIGAFPILFLTFPIFFWLIDGSTIVSTRGGVRAVFPAFAIGWWFGFGYFLAGLHWVGSAFLVEQDIFGWLMPIAVLALCGGLAIFTGVGAAIARLLWSASPWRVLAFAFGIGLSEFLRGHLFTGFPWNNFGYAFTATQTQMQLANLVGLYALTFLTVFCAVSPAVLADQKELGFVRKLPFFLAILIMGFQWAYGFSRLDKAQFSMLEGPLLRIVQSNLTQAERLNTKKREEIVERMIFLSSEPSRQQNGADASQGSQKLPTHIIWPESSLPFLLTSFPQVLSRIKTMLQPGQVLIAGMSRAEDAGAGSKEKNIFNSIYAFGDDGKVIDRYDKMHLVPFGEYIPFENILEAWGIKPLASLHSFSAGNQRQLITAGNAPSFAPLVCYEIIFPGEVVEGADRPGWLVNLSDDSWFGKSLGPYQHLHQARVQAVEEGLPVVRSTSTGISAVIDPYGRILAKLPLGAQSVIDTKLPKALPPTPFSKQSAKISFYFLAGFGLLAALLRKRSN
jgi:apolipoprotein N-acyltransferase